MEGERVQLNNTVALRLYRPTARRTAVRKRFLELSQETAND